MNPKAFISYSWSSPAHQEWVLHLATELRESGVDITLDKWDLKEGHDAHAFMEKMVTDHEIKKVIIICDKSYSDKANGRSGGVGAETQIITPELYGKQDQNKFVAVIAEKDENGSAYLPVFYKSRIYIDLSDTSAYSDGFEQLLRWIFDRPVHVKPKLGEVPSFLKADADHPKLLTTAKFRRAANLLRDGHTHAAVAASEYFKAISDGLEEFRIVKGQEFHYNEFDDAVVKSIEEFTVYRNECISLFHLLSTYADDGRTFTIIYKFFENIARYMDVPEGTRSWSEWDFDNFKFIVHELFLYAIAVLVKNEKFSLAARLMEAEYYVSTPEYRGANVMHSYTFFYETLESLVHRNTRLCLKRTSIHADMLKDRCKLQQVEFRDLIQADFILYLRTKFIDNGWWYPVTIIYNSRYSPFEVFSRSRSKKYFERVALLLGCTNKDVFYATVKQLSRDPDSLPRLGPFHKLCLEKLTGIDELETRP